jgi:hydroxyacylglutathione hydrolase
MTYKIIPIPAFSDNYMWLIEDSERKIAVCVDPGQARPVIRYLEQHHLHLDAILVTHHHADHVDGIHELAERYQPKVYGPHIEAIPGLTHPITGGDSIKLACFKDPLQVISIPGHTLGHVAYYIAPIIFTGDTLFTGGCGRLFEGTAVEMYSSLQKLAHLPPQTQIYCGHEYTEKNLLFALEVEPENQALFERLSHVQVLRGQGKNTVPSFLADELATNPFLRCNTPYIRAVAEQLTGTLCTDPVAVFAAIRAWKDQFKEDPKQEP